MVTRKILVIDDDKAQAEVLAKTLRSIIPNSTVYSAYDKDTIQDFIENKFYNLAVLDIRMDQFDFNGLDLARKILDVNPYAKILFVSRWISEYMPQLSPYLQNGNVLGFSDKKSDYKKWSEELQSIILPYYEQLDEDSQSVSNALINLYSSIKDEPDAYLKGEKFEDFIALLFQNIGFSEIVKRTRDLSLNEVDLIIRNEIDDPFLNKFGKYILVECKNHITKISKNDFILFKEKLKKTNGLAELGFLITTSSFKQTAFIEAVRESEGKFKIVFIDNAILMTLLKADDMREQLKRIIDNQVKDN